MYHIEINEIEMLVPSNGWMPKWIRPFLSEDPDECDYHWVDREDLPKYKSLPIVKTSDELSALIAAHDAVQKWILPNGRFQYDCGNIALGFSPTEGDWEGGVFKTPDGREWVMSDPYDDTSDGSGIVYMDPKP